MCMGVTAKSKAYEWVRNKELECPQTCLPFYHLLINVRVLKWSSHTNKALLKQSGNVHMGQTNELENPITKHTLIIMYTVSHKQCTTLPKPQKFFFSQFLWPEYMLVTHPLESINKSTHSLMQLATMSQRSASQFSALKFNCNRLFLTLILFIFHCLCNIWRKKIL